LVKNGKVILGIDPGYGRCGWGLIRQEGFRLIPLAHGVFETQSKSAFSDRLLQLFQALRQVIDEYSPAQAACEQLYFAKNVKTAIDVGQARGVILLACAQVNLPVFEYKPVEIKKACTGYGAADKAQVQAMISRLLQLQNLPRLDDAADALAVAICHAHSSGFNELAALKR
jgi:crossover junction endodeoxyribonuclease RuvC